MSIAYTKSVWLWSVCAIPGVLISGKYFTPIVLVLVGTPIALMVDLWRNVRG